MKNYVVDKTREVIRDFQRYNSYEKAYLFGQVLWLVAVAILITLTPVLVKILTDDTALTGIVRAVYQWTIAIGSLGAGEVFKAVSTRRVLITTSLMRGAIFGLVAILLFAQQLTFSLLVIITGINALIITISHLADFDMAGSNKVFSSAAKKEKARYLFTLLDYFVLLLLRPQGDEKREPAKMAQMIGFLAWKGESVSLRCSMKTSLGTTKGVCLQRAAQESLTTPRNNNNPQITSALFPRRSARLARGAGALLLAACFSATVPLFARDFYPQQDEYIPKLMKFLSEGSANKGALYQGTCGKLKDKWLPLSYLATPDYWTKYVANIPNNNLSVTDRYNSSNYTLTPVKTTPGADLQVERVMINYGTNIYDSACWQIALGVYGRSKDSGADSNKYFNLASNQTLLLTEGYDGNADSPAANANRAITKGDTFKYNGATITDPKNAFFFRMITRNWLSEDPFIRTAYLDKYVMAENLPRDNAAYARGKITWVDWKPITGENAWALLLGPIQLDRLKTASLHQSHVPFASSSVQNAIHALKAFSSMQAPIGCFYYACQGTLGNQGENVVDKYEVSVENNASALAGLLILKTTLEEEKKHEPSHSAAIQAALDQVNVMINGGKTVQNYNTEGLVQFFKKYAWDKTS
ncbi:MAG TPA: hypothetical protein VIT23_04060, partial [Terrimicrobiaceae bacterium]